MKKSYIRVLKGVCSKYQNRGKHIITTYLEHSSILSTVGFLSSHGFTVDYVKINDDGCVDIESLKRLLTNDTILVSKCMVDSELGIRQPIEKISEVLREYPKCFFHVDCTQALGKVPIDFSLMDFASVSIHKIFGMKGIGYLIKKKNIVIDNLIHGGKSSTTYRSGTPALPLIVSSMKALDLVMCDMNKHYQYVSKLNKRILDELVVYPDIKINSTKYSIPYTINISINNIKPETLVHAMDEYDIYISTKSACATEGTISDAVYAVTKNRERAMNSIRISISYKTKEEEVEEFLKIFKIVYEKLNMKR